MEKSTCPQIGIITPLANLMMDKNGVGDDEHGCKPKLFSFSFFFPLFF